MKGRVYTSFEEVDKDLRILQLKREIAREQVKGEVVGVKRFFEPPELFSFLGEGIVKKMLLSWLVAFVLRRFRK